MTEREIQKVKKWYEDYETIKQYKKDIESGEMNALKGAFCSYTGTKTNITEFEDKGK